LDYISREHDDSDQAETTSVPMNTPRFDVLESFFHWWMQGYRGGLFPSVHDGIARIGDYTGMILYRQPPFQVELWILPPNVEATEHCHPNTDIFLVHVTGEIKVWLGDDLVLGPAQTVADKNGVTKSNGNFVRLPPGQLHRAGTGPLGGAFMNIQLWLDGNPRFTAEDWKGDPLNDEHKKKLLGAYVRSLSESSASSTKEQRSISRRERAIAELEGHSQEASLSQPLIPGGVPPLNAAEREFGAASTTVR